MRKYQIILIALIAICFRLKSQNQCDTLQFKSNNSKLTGYFYRSIIPKSPTLIFTQGFMDTGDIWGLGKTLSENGINVFMFDFRGCFNSEGEQGLMNSQEDIGAAWKFLHSTSSIDQYQIDTGNIILGGYSFGGHMSMLYAINHPEIKRVISVSGGDLGILADLIKSDPDIRKEYTVFFQSIRKPEGPVVFEYEDPIQELMDNQDYFSILRQTINLSDIDLLLTGGLDDTVVSMEDYIMPLYRKLKENKQIKLECRIYQSGHSYNGTSGELLIDIANWIKDTKQ